MQCRHSAASLKSATSKLSNSVPVYQDKYRVGTIALPVCAVVLASSAIISGDNPQHSSDRSTPSPFHEVTPNPASCGFAGFPRKQDADADSARCSRNPGRPLIPCLFLALRTMLKWRCWFTQHGGAHDRIGLCPIYQPLAAPLIHRSSEWWTSVSS